MAQYATGGHVRTLGPPQSLHHYYNLIMDKIDFIHMAKCFHFFRIHNAEIGQIISCV